MATILLRTGLAIFWASFGVSGAPAQDSGAAKKPIHIGMVRSFLGDDRPKLAYLWDGPKKLKVLGKLFGDFVREQTGIDGKLVLGGDYRRVARLLDKKQIDVGIMHGFEFAWAQREFPELQPLLIAIYRDRSLSAHLVVRHDCPATSVADLKGGALALPMRTKGHCRLFLERLCQAAGAAEPKSHFNVMERCANVRAALDELVQGSVDAAVADGEFLQSYAQLKPGCFEKLRILAQSETFPAAVLVHRPGVIDPQTLRTFRDGLIKAHRSITGRDRMLMFKIGAFEIPPVDYDEQLADIRSAYPPPGAITLVGANK
ncbi:MAG: hypothetical protein FJ271_01810 [Planctomycetes bacterium]|nr:hypothetical protein [Planctomycetota bacterium]